MAQPVVDFPEMRVSDHAVVRWLERVRGLDVEAIRAEIREAALAGCELEILARGPGVFVDCPGDRVHLLIRGFEAVTVFNYDGEPD